VELILVNARAVTPLSTAAFTSSLLEKVP